MSSRKRQRKTSDEDSYPQEKYNKGDFDQVDSLLKAAENIDKDRIKDLIEADKMISRNGKDKIKAFLESRQPVTPQQKKALLNYMRLNGMVLFTQYPKVHIIENVAQFTKAYSQTPDERKRAISESRTEPRVVTDEVFDNTMVNTGTNRGAKGLNKTRGKSRRTRTRRSRKSRRTRK
jgi:hypothetical protein